MNTIDIENTLRRAPQPQPPSNLQQKLKAQAFSSIHRNAVQPPPKVEGSSWVRRWWPALAPAAVSLACAAGLTVQRLQIYQLKNTIAQPAQSAANGIPQPVVPAGSPPQEQAAPSQPDELARLRGVAARLREDVAAQEKTLNESKRLRAQSALSSSGVFSPEEIDAMQTARDKALRIQCVNNLKQLGLAVRIYANDNSDMTPPNVLSLSNELSGSFKILVCPADTGRQPANDPDSYTPANSSYEYLCPSSRDNEPNRIMFRCPIHGSITLCDGSVQSSVAKTHPNWIVQQDGKYYFRAQTDPIDSNAPAPAPSGH